ncbi:MAG: hypothetical protein H0T53_15470 [Herpetosiphonaceae bacterium]|nr:hypothetical protein [Herpetosiphonaceae bacterium]
MSEQLTKGFGGTLIPDPNPAAEPHPQPPLAPEEAQATPEDEAAATDLLGRTTDGPVAVNRELPPTADHYGRDEGPEA